MQDEAVNLIFTVNHPQTAVTTRGSLSTYPTDSEKWSEWERVVDGRYFYHVTLFLLRDDALVGYRDIYQGAADVDANNGFYVEGAVAPDAAKGEELQVSFLYDTPKHGAVERLKRGTYRLMVVANYSAYEADNGGTNYSYSGLDNGSFRTLVNGVMNDFGDDGIETFSADTYGDFFNYRLDAGSDYVCPQQPQPLTLVQDIELKPGDNRIAVQLVRTYARVRIEVENNSGTEDLAVKELSFSSNFAQRYAYLFDQPDDVPDSKYALADKGALEVTSSDALQSFLGSADAPLVIQDLSSTAEDNSKVIFDAYVLESKDETNAYTYTLDIQYPTEGEGSYTLKSTTSLSTRDALAADYDSSDHCYLIYNPNRDRFLKAGTTTVTSATLSLSAGMELDETYVWELERNGNNTNQYYLKTTGATAYYMGNPGNNSVGLDALKSVWFTAGDQTIQRNGYISLRSSGNGNYYLAINNNGRVQRSGDTGNSTRFHLYPVTKSAGGPQYDDPIILKTIDSQTAQVTAVNEIKRNDFIQVLVTVAYNKENGDFLFEVQDWNEKQGNIEFN